MKIIRQYSKLAGANLAILMLFISVPFDSVLAAMIETEAMLDLTRAKQAREEIDRLLLRRAIQDALLAHGIDPLEAKTRISSLSDAEVVRLAEHINKLPAGGGGASGGDGTGSGGGSHDPVSWPVFAAILFVIFLIVVIVRYATNNSSEPNTEESESPDSKKAESPEQSDYPSY